MGSFLVTHFPVHSQSLKERQKNLNLWVTNGGHLNEILNIKSLHKSNVLSLIFALSWSLSSYSTL